ncbi:fimbrial protein [Kluyvera sp. STS39-E]|uniref:fimbrial protein n=1 Tax=Kluyvera sp. STS39-E TaxID=3234748 RepID=UPI0034C66B88
MKKTLLAASLVLASGSVMAFEDGGQIDFQGMVEAGTCATTLKSNGAATVSGTSVVTLDKAKVDDITSEVQAAAVGAKPADFSILVDCSKATGEDTKVNLVMGSPSYANSKGTLDNNENVVSAGIEAAKGVNLAIHDVTLGTPVQVKLNNPADVHTQTLDTTSKIATYNFQVSYVKANSSDAVKAGFVSSNAVYSLSYE